MVSANLELLPICQIGPSWSFNTPPIHPCQYLAGRDPARPFAERRSEIEMRPCDKAHSRNGPERATQVLQELPYGLRSAGCTGFTLVTSSTERNLVSPLTASITTWGASPFLLLGFKQPMDLGVRAGGEFTGPCARPPTPVVPAGNRGAVATPGRTVPRLRPGGLAAPGRGTG